MVLTPITHCYQSMDGSGGKSRGVVGTDCYVSICLWPVIDSEKTGCLLCLDKANLSLVIGFITRHCEIRSLTEIWNRSQPVYCDEEELRNVQHLLCNCPVLGWCWEPSAGASLRVWILCREPIWRLSTDSLIAWVGWALHQCSLVFPFCLFCLVSASHSPFPTSSTFSHSFYYASIFKVVPYNGSIPPPGTIIVSVDKNTSSNLT